MTHNRWWATVRTRTTVVAVGVVLVALAAGAFGLVRLVHDRLLAADRSTALLRATDVLALASSDSLPAKLSYPGEENGATQVVAADGTVLAATANVVGERPVSSLRPLAGASTSEVRPVRPIDSEQRYVIVALTADDGAFTVLAATSLEQTEETVSALGKALWIGLPIVTLLVAATTRILVGRALRPVRTMTRQVSDITDRELDRRVTRPGTSDEIDELAATMNHMLDRLEASSDRQRRFVGDASHELRSPLASARTALEVAVLHPGGSAQLVAAIKDALVDHDRLDRLARDLLTLARLDDPRSRPELELVDLASLARSLVQRRPERSIDLELAAGEVHTSARSIEQVLTNLLDNAARHRRGRTRLAISIDPDLVSLVVDDDGPGVGPIDRERVFEAFVRLDEARSADEGTGLGLTIVKELASALGGTVDVRESELGGARFVVQLPTSQADAEL